MKTAAGKRLKPTTDITVQSRVKYFQELKYTGPRHRKVPPQQDLMKASICGMKLQTYCFPRTP